MSRISVWQFLISRSLYVGIKESLLTRSSPPPPHPWPVPAVLHRQGMSSLQPTIQLCLRINSVLRMFSSWQQDPPQQIKLPSQQLKSKSLPLISILTLQRHGQRQHPLPGRGLRSLPETFVWNIRLLHNLSLWSQLLHTGDYSTQLLCHFSLFSAGLHLPHSRAPVFWPPTGLSTGPARGQLGWSAPLDTKTQGIPQVRKTFYNNSIVVNILHLFSKSHKVCPSILTKSLSDN